MIRALHSSIAAVCPVNGVSVGDKIDKRTWRVDFAPEDTVEQRGAARSTISAFDVAAAEAAALAADRRSARAAQIADILIAKGIITEEDLA